jgi:putative ABC transport system permease protein
MGTSAQDIRYALRSLRKNPLFSLSIIVMLAVAIGFNGAVFSIADAVLFRQLPYPDPDRLAMLWERHPEREIERNLVSPLNYMDWKEQSRSFAAMGAFYVDSSVLTGDEGVPERVVAGAASVDMFKVLGVTPLLGRTFVTEEERAAEPTAAVLSHRLWRSRFGGDPGIVGKLITADGVRVQVVGVMPPGFEFPNEVQLWLPLHIDPQDLGMRGGRYLQVVGRLAPGVAPASSESEMDAIGRRLAAAYPDSNSGWTAHAVPLHRDLVGDVRPGLLTLLCAVVAVVLIACANVANLLLARAAGRQREMAVRTALGAGRGQLLRQLLVESLVLALAGGILGLALAFVILQLLPALRPGDIPRLVDVSLDARAVLYTLAMAILTGVVFGLAPALAASKQDLGSVLREGGRGTTGRGRALRALLVVGEVTLSFVLLIGAALLTNSFVRLIRVDPGFRPDHLLVADISLPSTRYADDPQRIAFFERLGEEAGALPGARSAAIVSHLPVSGVQGLWNNSFHVEGRPPLPPGVKIRSHVRWVTPGYFQTMGIPLQTGRDFSRGDIAGKANVVVIDEEMRRRYFPGEDPLGKRLVIYFGEREPREIVGVVGNVKQAELGEETAPHMYIPYAQSPQAYGTLVVRTERNPALLASAVKERLRAIDPELPIDHVLTMDEHLAESLARHRFNLLVLAAFAAVSLLLAALGIYSMIAYHVSQRQRELGVRMALGASPMSVVWLVVGQGMRLVLTGLALGLLIAGFATRLMSSLLYGIAATDPPTFLAVAAVLALVALVASYLPARRAAGIDPLASLRTEG